MRLPTIYSNPQQLTGGLNSGINEIGGIKNDSKKQSERSVPKPGLRV